MARVNMRNASLTGVGIACSLILGPALVRGQETMPHDNPAPRPGAVTYSNLYVKVQLDRKANFSALHPGDLVEGKLFRNVYWQDKELFPAGSGVRLIVDQLKKRRKEPTDHWPWIIKAFAPRHEKYPTFRRAQVSLPDGEQVPLQVSLISLGHEVRAHAEARGKKSRRQTESIGATPDASAPRSENASRGTRSEGKKERKAPAELIANFEGIVQKEGELPQTVSGSDSPNIDGALTLVAGSQAKVVLVNGISASKSRVGDALQARVVEPVYSGATMVLPEGSIFEGKVVKRTPPRMLSRAGSVLLSFTAVTRPGGASAPVSASLAGVEIDQRSHTRVDPEGRILGDRPGMAWMAINLATVGGIAKVADDGTQLVIELIVSTATDVSTAGSARIAGACASGILMLTRHGRDVILPRLTEMDIVFNRSVSLPASGSARVGAGSISQTHPEK